jgi:hypothetical protein
VVISDWRCEVFRGAHKEFPGLAAVNQQPAAASARTPSKSGGMAVARLMAMSSLTERPMAERYISDAEIVSRIRSEYEEMPGMRLTLPQAARLFDLDMTRCARVLDTLVTNGVLWTNGREFLRRDADRHFAMTAFAERGR